MTIALYKTFIIYALLMSAVFAKPLRHRKRENRLKESARVWSVKSDPKNVAKHDAEERNYGSQNVDVLSGQGHQRYHRGSDSYGLERNDRMTGSLQHGFRDGAPESADTREDQNFVSVSRGNAKGAEEDHPFGSSMIKAKRSSAPSEEVGEEDDAEGNGSKYEGVSAEDDDSLRDSDDISTYGGNQLNDVGGEGFQSDTSNAGGDSFNEIEEGEAVEGGESNIGTSSKIDHSYVKRGAENRHQAEDEIADEYAVNGDDKFSSNNLPQEQGYHRDMRERSIHQRDTKLRGPYELRRSKYKGQDEEIDQKEENDEEWDGAEYNNEDSAIEFPYEKGYLDVKGLDNGLGSDDADFGRVALVARNHGA